MTHEGTLFLLSLINTGVIGKFWRQRVAALPWNIKQSWWTEENSGKSSQKWNRFLFSFT